ncbi:hypothetical protein HK102_004709 [Quaeritorhiza haematococci]|nr:hypothetical protein HK102_004709 [Quaeritorhiza haematococci]
MSSSKSPAAKTVPRIGSASPATPSSIMSSTATVASSTLASASATAASASSAMLNSTIAVASILSPFSVSFSALSIGSSSATGVSTDNSATTKTQPQALPGSSSPTLSAKSGNTINAAHIFPSSSSHPSSLRAPTTTTTASPTEPNLLSASKLILQERCKETLNSVASVPRLYMRASGASENLLRAARAFGQCESTADRTRQSLGKVVAAMEELRGRADEMKESLRVCVGETRETLRIS